MDRLVHILGQLVFLDCVVALVELVVVDASVHVIEVVLQLVVLADSGFLEGLAVRVDLLHEVVSVSVHRRGVALRPVVRVSREVQVLHSELLHHLRMRVSEHFRALVEELVPLHADLYEHLPRVVVFFHILLRALQLLPHRLHLVFGVREERVQAFEQAHQLENGVALDVGLTLDALDFLDHRGFLLVEEVLVFFDVRVVVGELGFLQNVSFIVYDDDLVVFDVFAIVELFGLGVENALVFLALGELGLPLRLR